METALVAIAKDEDAYIGEWVDYHLKLGFDRIFIYQNNWRADAARLGGPHVCLIEFDGEAKQLEAYNDFLQNRSSGYDWCAMFDVDEFLVIKQEGSAYMNLHEWLKGFADFSAIGVNWRLFGDSGLEHVENANTSLVHRFTRCGSRQNPHIKTIVNLAKCRADGCISELAMADPHSTKQSLGTDFTISTDKSHFIHGPLNRDFDPTVQLNHYYCKTREEFVNSKMGRGRADLTKANPDYIYALASFDVHNENAVEDLTAFNFLQQS